MKQYFLLRENKESGPFTFETITRKNLLRSDLIWVEGLSTSWCHPTEFDELKEHVQLFHVTERKQRQTVQQPVVVEPNVAAHPQLKKSPEYSWLTGSKMHPLVLKERKDARERSLRTDRRFEFRNNTTVKAPVRGLWLAGLFAGMLATAFVVKKLVETFDEKQPETVAVYDKAATIDATVVEYPAVVKNNQEQAIHALVQQEAEPAKKLTPKVQ